MQTILSSIKQPSDLKALNLTDLKHLAYEIRKELIRNLSETGGHIGPNLGVVELTLALHRCFDTPKDKIIWDVGHQTYVHKLLTGRQEAFKTIRQFGGLSGFPKRNESIHDVYETGHSSTSISAALGFAAARDMKGEDHSVVAVIGDGALTGGLSFEALNNASHINKNFIVILNDNQMSIAKNVGGMSLYLDKVRTDAKYKEAKDEIQKVLRRIPKVGEDMIAFIRDVKDSIKQLIIPGMLFEEMGFTYLGPVDGHNMKQMMLLMNQAKKVDGPVMIHVHTVKGKGYTVAEQHPEHFHGTGPFDIKTGYPKKKNSSTSYSNIFGEKLTKLAGKNELIAAITAAMPLGTGLNQFKDRYPSRFFDVGIAEQHALTFASGLASAGYKPYVALYSSFLQRGYDQVVHDIACQNLNVTICVDRAGIVGADGETHQGIFDAAFLNHIPNMTILNARSIEDLEKCLEFSFEYSDGPLVIRYPRGGETTQVHYRAKKVYLGKSETLIQGNDIAVIFIGSMFDIATEVIDTLKKKGYNPSLINGRFTKPIDKSMLKKLAKTHKHAMVLEESSIIGGYGSEVLRYISRKSLDLSVALYGIEDQFVTHGSRQALMDSLNLDAHSIVKDFMKRI